MGRVVTNGTSMGFAKEASLGVLPATPAWQSMEPNTINQFGVTISKTARSPISRARTRRKGVTTDMDSGVEVDADVTLDAMRDFAEGFLFSASVGAPFFAPSAATATGYTVPAITAAQAAKMTYSASGAKSLLFSRGWLNGANNGVQVLNAAVAAGNTSITVATANVVETAPATTSVEVAVAGVRAAAGDLKVNAAGNITSTALNFTQLGLVPGQVIWVGGLSVTNQFFNPANTGFARVAAVSANLLTLAKREQPFVTDDGTSTGNAGTALAIDLLFGQFVRNVPVGSTDYLETSYQFELVDPNLGTAGATMYEYSLGNWADAWSVSMPLTDKATMTFGFVGTDTRPPVATRANQAANMKGGGQLAGFSTSTDLARLRAQDVDETGLTTDFKELTFTLTNNVAGEKVLGNLGPKYLNAGQIEVDVEATLVFSNPNVIERIRCNRTVGLDFALRNGDGGVVIDLPTCTIAGGGREYPANQSVTIATTFEAYQDDLVGFSCGVSFFPVLPAVACP